jgi:hypothetical protein
MICILIDEIDKSSLNTCTDIAEIDMAQYYTFALVSYGVKSNTRTGSNHQVICAQCLKK